MSMIQQIHFIVAWKAIRDATYQIALAYMQNSPYVFVSTFNELDTTLFLIRFYCYNVESLLFLFWAIGLWRATWKARVDLLRLKDENIVLAAKIFALVFPILIVSTMRNQAVMSNPIAKLIWPNIILIFSTSTGCVFLVLILCTYLHVRHKVISSKTPGSMPNMDISFRVNRSGTENSGMPTKPAPASNMRSMSYDRWLIARFLVCFALSNALQVCLISYYILMFDRNTRLLSQQGPDYSLQHTLDDLAITMSSVSSGLIIFIVFGTTAPFRREYKKWLHPGRRKCQGRDGPIMVAPLHSINAANNQALSSRRRPFDEGKEEEEGHSMTTASGRRSSASSTWEIPPMHFDEFSEKEVLPRPTEGE